MSLGVGLPMMKLKPGKCGTRSGMGVREACLEAGSERASKTETLDKSKSGGNYRIAFGPKRPDGKHPIEYVDVPSGKEMAEFFETAARDYSERRKKEGKKALRKDAPIAATFIIKPEMEKAANWGEKDVKRFAIDSLRAWKDVWGHVPDYAIVHMDEGGPHIHVFDRMLDVNGDYRMSKVVTRSKLCEWHSKYVDEMNRRGYDVDAHDGLNDDGSPRTHSGQSAKEHAKQEAFDKEQAAERAEFEKQKAELEKQKEQVERDRLRLDAHSKDVSRREAAVEDKERDSLRRANKAKRALDGRESRVDERERAVTERERAVTAREKAVESIEDERKQQMEQVKREVETYKNEQMERTKSRVSEYEARRKAEVVELVRAEKRHKLEAVDSEVSEYREERLHVVEGEVDEQVKAYSRRKCAEVDERTAAAREKQAAALGMNLEQTLDRWALPFMVKCLRGVGALARKQGLTMNGESIGDVLDRAANALDGIRRSGKPQCMIVDVNAGKACGKAMRDVFASRAEMQQLEIENHRAEASLRADVQGEETYGIW